MDQTFLLCISRAGCPSIISIMLMHYLTLWLITHWLPFFVARWKAILQNSLGSIFLGAWGCNQSLERSARWFLAAEWRCSEYKRQSTPSCYQWRPRQCWPKRRQGLSISFNHCIKWGTWIALQHFLLKYSKSLVLIWGNHFIKSNIFLLD